MVGIEVDDSPREPKIQTLDSFCLEVNDETTGILPIVNDDGVGAGATGPYFLNRRSRSTDG